MEKKEKIKISLSIFLLSIVIVVMGFLIYNFLNEKNTVENETGSLNENINSLEGTPNTENTSKETNAMEKFSYEDLIVDDLKYGMTEEQVVEIMGEPEQKNENTSNQDIYGESIDYIYGDLSLSFYKHEDTMLLSVAGTNSIKYTFAKGLKVGDTKEKVISSFYREDSDENKLRDISTSMPPEPGESFGKYLYGHAVDSSVSDAVKETGNVEYAFINYYGYNLNDSESTYMIEYHYAEPPYTSNYAEGNEVNGTLVFDMNSDDVVTYIRWYFNPKNPD